MTRLLKLICLWTVFAVLVGACAGAPAQPEQTALPDVTQPEQPSSLEPVQTEQPSLPNPASAYCEEQGGQLEMRSDTEGNQVGICIFPDGSECDEWAFYRDECRPAGSPVEPAPLPGAKYSNASFGFSFDLPSGWEIEEYPDYVLFSQPGYQLFVGFQLANEQPKPFRTGMPSGDFVDGGSLTLLGQQVPKQLLVFEGKTKVVSYGGRLKIGEMILIMYLDPIQVEGQDYADLHLSEEIIAEVDGLIGTFALTSGEKPVIQINP